MIVTFTYFAQGESWHTGSLDTGLTAQGFADQLAAIHLNRPTDEIRVWEGTDTDREPDAIATRPLSALGNR